jgi:hypothetical protein
MNSITTADNQMVFCAAVQNLAYTLMVLHIEDPGERLASLLHMHLFDQIPYTLAPNKLSVCYSDTAKMSTDNKTIQVHSSLKM